MTSEQLDLLEFMEDVSQRCYCATWMDGLERELWDRLFMDGDSTYGQSKITTEDKLELCRLALRACGWMRWDDAAGEVVFIPIDERTSATCRVLISHNNQAKARPLLGA